MYPSVPATVPGRLFAPSTPWSVAVSLFGLSPLGETSLARPKSSTLTNPSSVTITFAGLTSRCTIPEACALASASAIGIETRRTSPSRIPCFGIISSRLRPRTYSITMKSIPSADSIS